MRKIIYTTLVSYFVLCGIAMNAIFIIILKAKSMPAPEEIIQVLTYSKGLTVRIMLILLVTSILTAIVRYYEDKRAPLREKAILEKIQHGYAHSDSYKHTRPDHLPLQNPKDSLTKESSLVRDIATNA